MKTLTQIVSLVLILVILPAFSVACADTPTVRKMPRDVEAKTPPAPEASPGAADSTESGDTTEKIRTKPVKLTRRQLEACKDAGLEPSAIRPLIAKPLYRFDESELDTYLRYMQAFSPELPDRIRHLARKNIGQPYELYLLGEMPFEHHDPQPIYCLDRSDCLVYAEHTYAMALSDSWPKFIRMLQRIRYADGAIGVATRNHYTEADWNPNNTWLVRDITEDVARARALKYTQTIDRSKFLKGRYKLETDIPIEERVEVFLPFEHIDQAKPRLRDGDFVNIVRGTPPKPGKKNAKQGKQKRSEMEDIFGGSAWVGHVGMIVIGEDGEVNLIHSARPEVREESLDDYIAASTKNLATRDAEGKARLLGFKFLRLRKDPIANLHRIDGEDAPIVTLPDGGKF